MKLTQHILICFKIILLLTACENKSRQTVKSDPLSPIHSDVQKLKKYKGEIDKLIAIKDSEQIIVLVKIPDNNKLVKVYNDNFPAEVETTYNFLKDKAGRVIFAAAAPTSESGDWSITYKSYFDKNGNLFAFERIASFFNSECTTTDDGAAHEDLIKFYNNKKIVDSTYTLKDSKKKPLIKSKCVFNYDYPYTILFDWKSFKNINKINIP